MNLNVGISFDPCDEDDEMAYVYCWDKEKQYCFSLTRLVDSNAIEIMVSDQINEQILDLDVVLTRNEIAVKLDEKLANSLDGNIKYVVSFSLSDDSFKELKETLDKIFENKHGFRCEGY